MIRPSSIATVAVALLWGTSALAGAKGALTASAGPGVDSNPSRTVGGDERPDGFFGLAASGRGRIGLGESSSAHGRYELGLRKFFREADEDLAVQQLGLGVGTALGSAAAGMDLSGKWRFSRSGARDYLDGSAELYFDVALAETLSARLSAGARGFAYFPERGYDSVGPQAVASLRWQPVRRHGAGLSILGAAPFYRGLARLDETGAFAGKKRRDTHLGGAVHYAYRGPAALQLGYSTLRIGSSSFGESSDRHRVWAAGSLGLGGRLFLSAQAAWQLIRYPDGVFLSQALLLLDDESQSSAGAKLAFAATEAVDLEARYAVYWIGLPEGRDATGTVPAITWWRHTATVGIAVRL